MHLREVIRNVMSLPKTIYFNFKVLDKKDAFRLPFFVDKDIKLGKLYKNVIKLNFEANRFWCHTKITFCKFRYII